MLELLPEEESFPSGGAKETTARTRKKTAFSVDRFGDSCVFRDKPTVQQGTQVKVPSSDGCTCHRKVRERTLARAKHLVLKVAGVVSNRKALRERDLVPRAVLPPFA